MKTKFSQNILLLLLLKKIILKFISILTSKHKFKIQLNNI